MNDVEDRVRSALAARAAVTEPTYDAMDELLQRIGRARKRRRSQVLAFAAGLIVLLAVVLPVTLTHLGRDSGAPPAAPITQRSPALVPTPSSLTVPSPSTTTPPAILDHRFFFGMLDGDTAAVFDARSGHRTGANMTIVQGAEAVAGWPGTGFLVAQRTADGCHTKLVPIFTNWAAAGTSVLAPQPGLLDEIVISPDGRRLAAVERSCSSANVDVLVLDFSTGMQHRWLLPGPGMNAVNGLSWSPDGARLAYTSGVNTGGGLGGGYTQLDANASGGTLSAVLPGTGQVEIANSRCEVDRGFWLGTTGKFAVFAYCPNSDALFLAQVPFGASVPRGQVIASVPGERATLFPDASATNDGRHLLLTTDDATYRIDDGKVFRLDGHWRSPSW